MTQFAEACFKRARALIGNPLDTVNFTLDDVPTLTMMAFYLIEINRRDAAYSKYISPYYNAVHHTDVFESVRKLGCPHCHHTWQFQILQRRGKYPQHVDFVHPR
jgi:hypothetical protein